MASRDDSNVVDLGSRAGYRPDMAALARAQVASARERLGLSTEEFASVPKPPPGDLLIAASIVTQAAPLSADEVDKDDLMHQLLGNRYADVEAVFLSRSEFTSAMPPQRLFAGATKIDAAG